MFRKAAIVLALAASFLGAQAKDMPRDLKFKNHTKAAKPNSGAKSKAKTVTLCLVDNGKDLQTFYNAVDVPSSYLFSSAFNVYDCADTTATGAPNSGALAIGTAGLFCAFPVSDPLPMAPCTSQIVLNTAWHKTTKQSSVGVVFQMDPTVYVTTATAGQITMDNTLVTGSNGAWGKTDKIHAVMLEPIAGSNNENYELTLTYKGRGWNPTA